MKSPPIMGKDKGVCDRKMVSQLDSIPYKDMPKWGTIARTIINNKQKLGLGVGSFKKNFKWTNELVNELHKPVCRTFSNRRVYVDGVGKIWAADLVDTCTIVLLSPYGRYVL